MNMEFLGRNIVNTTTVLSATAGTTTLQYLFDRKNDTKWIGQTSGANDFIYVTLTSSEPISRIALTGCNFKTVAISYLLPTGSSSLLTILNANTTSANWSNNTSEDLYLYFNTITTTQITIDINDAFTTTAQYELQQLWICDKIHTLERNPAANSYSPNNERKEYIHKMSGGGVTQFIMSYKYYDSTIKLDYVSESETTSLLSVYDNDDGFTFVPFPTGTSWDGKIYECIWSGKWNFDQFSDNNKTVGYAGSIQLMETAK